MIQEFVKEYDNAYGYFSIEVFNSKGYTLLRYAHCSFIGLRRKARSTARVGQWLIVLTPDVVATTT